MDIRDVEEKEMLRRVVRAYLEAESPECLEEFDVVYDSVYETIQGRLAEKESARLDHPQTGIGFDSGMVAGTAISIACWVGLTLLRAILRDSAKRDLPLALNHVEPKVAGLTGNPQLVHKLRERFEGIVQRL